MEFKVFNQKVKEQFAKMCKTGKLFRSDVSGDELWTLYISSFKDEKIFRDPESSEHNCNCCKHFIRRYGNIVAIMNTGKLECMFSNLSDAGEYTPSVEAMNKRLLESEIQSVFFETYDMLNISLNYEVCKKDQETYKLGIEKNFKKYTQEEADKFGVVNTETVYEFNHFNVVLPKQFVDFTGQSIEQILAHYNDKYSVFKRGLLEIPLDTLELVEDLINQGSLLDGTAHLHAVQEFKQLKKEYELNLINKELFYWGVSYSIDERGAKFKNTLVGVLCTELAEGKELNKACEDWNKRVDPANYHKATAPITKRQIDEAKKFVEENGYIDSFNRRLAAIDDIKASEILHMNSGDGKIKEVSIFDNVKATSTRHKRSELKNVEEVSIQKFMDDILSKCTGIEAYLENRMEGNLVTLTAPVNPDAKQFTKWNGVSQNFSWTYNGNLAGKSQIKEAVKEAGGVVDGVLNFRLAWNDGDGSDNSDLDAWAKEPDGTKIGYNTSFRKDQGGNRTGMSGQLDVDNTNPGGKMGVENITWIKKDKMMDGVYKLWVNQYAARSSKGFKVEIEIEGDVYTYSYNQSIPTGRNVQVAEVTLKDGIFTVKHILPETNESNESNESKESKELWGLETNNFHKVNLVCTSPNHWGDNKLGNLHYFLMLEGCRTKNKIRGFHNENLLPELLKHRKVMEVLGATNMIEPADKQLSGIGFNSTVRDELIVKCSGSFKRMLKIKF